MNLRIFSVDLSFILPLFFQPQVWLKPFGCVKSGRNVTSFFLRITPSVMKAYIVRFQDICLSSGVSRSMRTRPISFLPPDESLAIGGFFLEPTRHQQPGLSECFHGHSGEVIRVDCERDDCFFFRVLA